MLVETNGRLTARNIWHIIVLLIISELPIFPRYFDRDWPLFGRESGFTTLAAVLVILGVDLLGDLADNNCNDDCQNNDPISASLSRIILSAGILALVMGVINLVAVSST